MPHNSPNTPQDLSGLQRLREGRGHCWRPEGGCGVAEGFPRGHWEGNRRPCWLGAGGGCWQGMQQRVQGRVWHFLRATAHWLLNLPEPPWHPAYSAASATLSPLSQLLVSTRSCPSASKQAEVRSSSKGKKKKKNTCHLLAPAAKAHSISSPNFMPVYTHWLHFPSALSLSNLSPTSL